MNQLFALIAIALVLAAYVPYVIKILRGKVKPNPITWLIFSMAGASVFALQTSYGSGTGAYATGAMALSTFCVFLASARHGIPRIQLLDAICLVVALLGVGIWLVVQEPVASIVIFLCVEVIGFVPTVIKGFKKPYEDSATLWILIAGRHALGFLAIEHYNIVTTLTPSAWVVMGTSFCLILLIRRIPKKKPRGRKRTFQPYA